MEWFAEFEPKDWITLFASLSALTFSLLSYLQKSTEGVNVLRKQLTDTLQKLSDLNLDVAKFRVLPEEERRKLPNGYVIHINTQRRFLARQAAHIAETIPKLVGAFEYVLLAETFGLVDEVDQAEYFFERATAQTPLLEQIESLMLRFRLARSVERAIALRTYARFLFVEGRATNARKKLEESLYEFGSEGDRLLTNRLRTLALWAEWEEQFGSLHEAARLSATADEVYERLSEPGRRRATFQYSELERARDRITERLRIAEEESVPAVAAENEISSSAAAQQT